jgi:hypothetical protein
MAVYSLEEARSNLDALIARALQGEAVSIVAEDGAVVIQAERVGTGRPIDVNHLRSLLPDITLAREVDLTAMIRAMRDEGP